MKEKLINFTFCLLCILAIIFIFQNNNEVASIIIESVNLFFNKVFVSLFPMFIINDILIAFNFPYYFYIIFNKLFNKLFKTSGICAYVFIMSLISGTPSNAYILKNLVENNLISNEEANHYLYFTYFSNPLFLTLMLSMLFDTNAVIKIIIIHYVSNIIIGLLLRNKAPKIINKNITSNSNSFGSTLTKSINRTITTLLMILGTIVFYMLLSFIITKFININFFKVIISGLLEITNGLNLLCTLNISLKIKEIIAISIISFGGLSIHTQIKSILENTNINYLPFLKGRLYQVLISIILIIIF
ncbi:MAG: hypothetical protein E7163_00335 [Firmicutes bacterium]|nr:hypothetical protein [Bacillota bacterium]